jgi:hypothetical protein
MKTTTISMDLAKNVFQIHGVYEYGHPSLNRGMIRIRLA